MIKTTKITREEKSITQYLSTVRSKVHFNMYIIEFKRGCEIIERL